MPVDASLQAEIDGVNDSHIRKMIEDPKFIMQPSLSNQNNKCYDPITMSKQESYQVSIKSGKHLMKNNKSSDKEADKKLS